MTADEHELEKLLAEVRRTIRDNDLFIRHMKKESDDAEKAEEEPVCDVTPEDGGYEEL